jgi:hypothetical protein
VDDLGSVWSSESGFSPSKKYGRSFDSESTLCPDHRSSPASSISNMSSESAERDVQYELGERGERRQGLPTRLPSDVKTDAELATLVSSLFWPASCSSRKIPKLPQSFARESIGAASVGTPGNKLDIKEPVVKASSEREVEWTRLPRKCPIEQKSPPVSRRATLPGVPGLRIVRGTRQVDREVAGSCELQPPEEVMPSISERMAAKLSQRRFSHDDIDPRSPAPAVGAMQPTKSAEPLGVDRAGAFKPPPRGTNPWAVRSGQVSSARNFLAAAAS